MTELAPCSVDAEARLAKIRVAKGHSELACHMGLLNKLVLAMCKCTLVTELAVVVVEPVLANFCLLFLLISGLICFVIEFV